MGGREIKTKHPLPAPPLILSAWGRAFSDYLLQGFQSSLPSEEQRPLLPPCPFHPQKLVGPHLTWCPANQHCQSAGATAWAVRFSQLLLVNNFYDTFNLNILKHAYIQPYMIRQAIELRTSKFALPKARRNAWSLGENYAFAYFT